MLLLEFFEMWHPWNGARIDGFWTGSFSASWWG